MANVFTFLSFFTLAFVVAYGISSPSIIKESNGQIFKCVNFFKQPAFRNSSLNDEVTPKYIAKLQQQKRASGFGLGSGGCPIGTVPVLVKPDTDGRDEPRPPPRPHAKEHCIAKVQTVFKANKKFYGADSAITIYKPEVQSNQWSSSRIKLTNDQESIEAGWMVNPNEFKDNEAHLYASFNAAGKGCTNLACTGFVQVSTDIPLGIAPSRYSTVSSQIVWNISIDKHQDDGHWWLSIKSEKHQIGYWPRTLFSTLANAANHVEFGGEINDPSAITPAPAMGNGLMADYDTKYSSCFFHATVVDEHFNNVNPPDTEKVATCQELYTVLDGGYHDDPSLGRLIFYGGPGPDDVIPRGYANTQN